MSANFLALIFLPFFWVTANAFDLPVTSIDLKPGKPGGKLIFALTGDPKSFNPITAQETSTTVVTSFIFEGLIKLDPISLQPQPGLAISWQHPDAKTWIFKLRQDVFWQDHERFSADDVLFTFNQLIYNPDVPNSSRDIFTIDDQPILVEKIDQFTVKFILPKEFSPFLRAMSQEILPKHKYEKSVQEKKFSFSLGLDSKVSDIVGTGAFKITEYLPGERIILSKNPYYYKRDQNDQALPYLDQIILQIVPSPDAVLLKFKEGQLDYCPLRPQDLAILGPLSKKNNFKIYNAGPEFGQNFITFNLNPRSSLSQIFSRQEFRQAVLYGLDRQKMIKIVFNGLGQIQHSPISSSNQAYYDPNIYKFEYDPNKARQLLASLGFKEKDQNGILKNQQGQKLQFSLYTNADNSQRLQLASLAAADLNALGIKVNVVAVDFNTLVTKLTATKDWDAVLIGLTGGIEPYFGRNVWSYKASMHFWNMSKQAMFDWEKEIDDIFDQSIATVDETKRRDLFIRWQKIAAIQAPFIHLITPDSLYAVRNRFGNLFPTAFGGAFSQVEYIYVFD